MKIVELTSPEGRKMNINLAHVLMIERYETPTKHTLVHTVLKAKDGTPVVFVVREDPQQIAAL